MKIIALIKYIYYNNVYNMKIKRRAYKMRSFVPYELPIDKLIKPMVFYNELISASTNLGK